MESNRRICPNCRTEVPADAPEGICPACALRAGFASEVTIDAPTRVATPEGSEPLSAAILAERLPELDGFELIGRGGMGSVYRARQRNLDRPVAVKILDARLSAQPTFAERFAREARTLAQLDHPNVVRVYDFGQREGMYYLLMELVDGISLREAIRAGGMEPAEALALVPEICAALQYAHDRGVVHRDIKPENILISRDGAVKIADFGLAKLVGGGDDLHLTRVDQVMGTPNYMAPEQFEDPEHVDHRADIFALGVVFYEMLTGELPIGRFPVPSQRVAVDVRLDEVVLRTLEKEPRRRYQQAGELRTDVMTLSGAEAAGSAAASGDSAPKAAPRRAAAPGPNGKFETVSPNGFSWRSPQKVLGLPLIHICFARDPKCKKMGTASGIIAIGDVALGAIAIGGFPFGLLSVGGMGLGLIGLGGMVPGLLLGIGGIGAGGIAIGGLAFGGFSIGLLAFGYAGIGAGPSSPLHTVLSEAAQQRWVLAAWSITAAAAVTAIWAAIKGWAAYVRAKEAMENEA